METWLKQLEKQSEGLHKCMEVCIADHNDMNCQKCRMWSNETGCAAYGLDYTEMFKLRDALSVAGIPYEIGVHQGGYLLCYPAYNRRERVCSVILHAHSYGAFVGRLEICGLLTPEEGEVDSVVGYLTAADVYVRIVKHWKENK